MIKVCINPHCDEVAHNVDAKETHCRNCDFRMIIINDKTYNEKFKNSPMQVDYKTGLLLKQI